MTPEEYLARAADRVEKGWIRGKMYDKETDKYCILGALEGWECPEAYDAMKKEIEGLCGWPSLMVWNDTKCQSAEEAASTLRNAKRWL